MFLLLLLLYLRPHILILSRPLCHRASPYLCQRAETSTQASRQTSPWRPVGLGAACRVCLLFHRRELRPRGFQGGASSMFCTPLGWGGCWSCHTSDNSTLGPYGGQSAASRIPSAEKVPNPMTHPRCPSFHQPSGLGLYLCTHHLWPWAGVERWTTWHFRRVPGLRTLALCCRGGRRGGLQLAMP